MNLALRAERLAPAGLGRAPGPRGMHDSLKRPRARALRPRRTSLGAAKLSADRHSEKKVENFSCRFWRGGAERRSAAAAARSSAVVTRSAFRRSHEQHLIPASQQTPARAEWFWRVARFVARDVRLDATPRKGFRCGLVSRPANSYHPFKVAAESREELALHRALRRMAGLVFLLVFWVLAGACQRHGVGGFLSFNSPSPSRFCRGAWWPAGTTTGNREREKDR